MLQSIKERTLSVMPTYQCTASCNDCGTFSSPAEKATQTIEAMKKGIYEASLLDFKIIVFTGGEATLRYSDLVEGIEYASSLGLATRLVTNGYWATSMLVARKKIEVLKLAGLTEINFSTGTEHVKFISLEKVINGICAALELQLPTMVMVELGEHALIKDDDILQHTRIAELSESRRKLLKVIESPWSPMDPDIIGEYPADRLTNKDNISSREPCTSILNTYTLQPDGRIGACCGLGLRIIPELNVGFASDENSLEEAIDEAESDFIKIWLHIEGPERILEWASEIDPSIEWENMYAHHCQACLRIFDDPKIQKVIKENYRMKASQVYQSLWLDYVFNPSQLISKESPDHAQKN